MNRRDALKRLALLVFAPEVVVDLAEAASKIRVEPAIVPAYTMFEPVVYRGALGGGKSDAFYAYGRMYLQELVKKTKNDLDRQIWGRP